jgi:hypothetical protein
MLEKAKPLSSQVNVTAAASNVPVVVHVVRRKEKPKPLSSEAKVESLTTRSISRHKEKKERLFDSVKVPIKKKRLFRIHPSPIDERISEVVNLHRHLDQFPKTSRNKWTAKRRELSANKTQYSVERKELSAKRKELSAKRKRDQIVFLQNNNCPVGCVKDKRVPCRAGFERTASGRCKKSK